MPNAFTPVFLVAEIRAIEQAALAQSPAPPLMERAGLAAARLARDLLGAGDKRVLLFAGPGNNGGDALVMARQLKASGCQVSVLFTGSEQKLSADAKAALDAWTAAGGSLLQSIPSEPRWDLVVDGLFGIGLERPLEGRYAELVNWINDCNATVLALDIPSGLHADSGRVLGIAVRAHHTLTFIGLKAGLLTLDGPDYCGNVSLDTLGVDIPGTNQTRGWRIETALLETVLSQRLRNTHKGSYGTVGIFGGAPGMIGAALLAGRAALKLGAGKVVVGLFADAPAVDLLQPELMLRPAQELLKMPELDCIAFGPGLGDAQAAQQALAAVIGREAPLVLDADALNLLAAQPKLQKALAARTAASLLTPHPAEAARLLGRKTDKIQFDRVAAARELAGRYRAAVVLKGSGSVCALKSGDWFINTSGNPGMASAGMGDVLTGMIAALISQGVEPEEALLCGVHLHGLAADQLVGAGTGPAGLTASEVIDAARKTLNRCASRRLRR